MSCHEPPKEGTPEYDALVQSLSDSTQRWLLYGNGWSNHMILLMHKNANEITEIEDMILRGDVIMSKNPLDFDRAGNLILPSNVSE